MADQGKGGGGGKSIPLAQSLHLSGLFMTCVHVHSYFMYGSMQVGKYGNLYRPTLA